MNRAQVILTLLTAVASTSFAQHSITLTSPTSGQVIQGTTLYGQWPTVHPTAIVVDSSGNSTAYVLYLFNGKPFADNVNISYISKTGDPNWTATFNAALWGDGTGTMQAISFDIFGNQLAASSIVSFQLRVSGGTQGVFNTFQTSGAGVFNATSVAGINTSAVGGQFFIDGRGSDNEWQTSGGGWINGPYIGVGKTNRFLNGPHEVMFATGTTAGSVQEPFIIATSFANSAVSGSSITLTGHMWKTLEPVVLSTTGTLPSPLVVGTAWYWTTSSASIPNIGNSNTFTASVSSGVMTITTSSAHGISPGASVYVFNAAISTASYQQSGSGAVQLCDGLYTAVTASGTTITLNTPSCPNGTYAPSGMEVYTNPYFANYIDNGTVSLSATPGGAPISLNTSVASGTHTITGRPYWNPQIENGSRLANNGSPLFFAYQNVTFANGTTPSELRPAFAEMHGIAGTTGPSLCNGLQGGGATGPLVFNTDGTSTTINCNAVTYTPTTDLVSGVVTVDSTGNPTFVNPGWTHVIVACPSCAPAGPSTTYTVTGASWSAGTATITIGPHGISVGQHFSLSGVSPSGYNGADLVATNILGTSVNYLVASNPGTYVSGGTAVSTTLPSVTVWIQVQSGSVTFPHFTVNGVTSTYIPGQSLFPRTMWNLDTYGWLNPGFRRAVQTTVHAVDDAISQHQRCSEFRSINGRFRSSSSWPVRNLSGCGRYFALELDDGEPLCPHRTKLDFLPGLLCPGT